MFGKVALWLALPRSFRQSRWLMLIFLVVRVAYSQTAAALDPAGNIWRTDRIANTFTCGSFKIPPGFYENISCHDATVTELDPSGTHVLYTTTLGGHGDSGGLAIAADSAGNIYVAGYTTAPDFPVTTGAFQTKNAGPYTSQMNMGWLLPGGNAFIVKLNPSGALVYSTFLGGSGNDVPSAISVDGAGSVYIVGSTSSPDFPLTASPFSNTPTRGFVAKIRPSGQSLNFSTYFPASILALAIDSAGAVYLAGSADATLPTTRGSVQTTFGGGFSDAFVAKMSASGDSLIYSTYLGGSNGDSAYALAVDSQRAVWVGGSTFSPNFPTTGAGAAFLVKLAPDGSTIQTGRRFGTTNAFRGISETTFIAVDAQDHVYASGEVNEAGGFQPTPNAHLSIPCATFGGNFLIESASDGTLLYASYLRQTGTIFVIAPGHLLIAAKGGVLVLDLTSAPSLNFQCPVNAASYTVPAAPGEIVTLFGYGLGPLAGVQAQPDSSGRYPTSLAGVQVRFDGVPVPLLYVQAGQVNTVVPNQYASDFYTVEVSYQGQSAPALEAYGDSVNPGVFAVMNQDWTLNSFQNPAKSGSILHLYATGMNLYGLDFPDGQVVPPSTLLTLLPFNVSLNGNAVLFGGMRGTILWEGAAPGLIFGVEQIDVQLPASLPVPASAASVPMVVQASYVSLSPVFPVVLAP